VLFASTGSCHLCFFSTKLISAGLLTGLSITVVLYCYSAYNLDGPTLFPFVALSVALNISLTLAIVGRLYYLRKRIAVLGPEHGKTYTTLASMFFESGALYSIMGIIYLGSLRSHSHAQDVLSTPLQQSVVSFSLDCFTAVTLMN
jgi:hypothetical protein